MFRRDFPSVVLQGVADDGGLHGRGAAGTGVTNLSGVQHGGGGQGSVVGALAFGSLPPRYVRGYPRALTTAAFSFSASVADSRTEAARWLILISLPCAGREAVGVGSRKGRPGVSGRPVMPVSRKAPGNVGGPLPGGQEGVGVFQAPFSTSPIRTDLHPQPPVQASLPATS